MSEYHAHAERGNGANSGHSDGVDDGQAVSPNDVFVDAEPGVGAARHIEAPTAESLIDCVHSGWMSKRGYKMGCVPSWKRRFFILKGQYLFKFSSPTGSAPKGAPIPVLGLQCTVGPVDPHASEHSHTMTLATIRKEYVVGAGSAEELSAWMDAISRAKSHSIKQQLGHVPQSDSDDFANRSGAFLTQRRLDRESEEVERGVGGSTAVVF